MGSVKLDHCLAVMALVGQMDQARRLQIRDPAEAVQIPVAAVQILEAVHQTQMNLQGSAGTFGGSGGRAHPFGGGAGPLGSSSCQTLQKSLHRWAPMLAQPQTLTIEVCLTVHGLGSSGTGAAGQRAVHG